MSIAATCGVFTDGGSSAMFASTARRSSAVSLLSGASAFTASSSCVVCIGLSWMVERMSQAGHARQMVIVVLRHEQRQVYQAHRRAQAGVEGAPHDRVVV